MDRKHLISLLQRSAAGHLNSTPFCPDDQDIAAFVEGTLNDAANEHVARHLPECQACVSRVGLLTRLMREDSPDAAHEIAQPAIKKWTRTVPQWAAAASVVLAVGYLAGTSGILSSSETAEDYRSTRNNESRFTAPEILAPSSGVIGSRDGFVIRWTDVPGSLYYEVHVITDAGDLVSEQRVYKTEWTIDGQLDLEPDREYFIRVDAYLSDAQPIRSRHIPFTVRE